MSISDERLRTLIGVMSKLPNIGEFDRDVVAALRELASLRSRYAGVEAALRQIGCLKPIVGCENTDKCLRCAALASKGPSDPEAVT